MPRHLAYVLVTPARNEAKFIPLTLASVVQQTALPLRWVIVDDGSTDGTAEIVGRYASRHPWIEVVTLAARHEHDFAGKVRAFNAGYERAQSLDFEVVGNLDGDVSFDPDYLQFLLDKFAADPRLGVAGTPYTEVPPIRYERFKSSSHVSGACQLFRRRCYEDIGGYPPVSSGGVDFIAVLSAQAKGWTTQRFEERTCMHHRAVGSGGHERVLHRMFALGRKDYRLGSHPAFEIFRCMYRTLHPPYLVGGALMAAGYLSAWASRTELSMGPELVRFRRQDQVRRLKAVLAHPTRHMRRAEASAARSDGRRSSQKRESDLS